MEPSEGSRASSVVGEGDSQELAEVKEEPWRLRKFHHRSARIFYASWVAKLHSQHLVPVLPSRLTLGDKLEEWTWRRNKGGPGNQVLPSWKLCCFGAAEGESRDQSDSERDHSKYRRETRIIPAPAECRFGGITEGPTTVLDEEITQSSYHS